VPEPLAQRSFTAEDRIGHHRLVATAMLVTFGVIFISQNWWKSVRNFIEEKTHGASSQVTKPGG
jgi:hypothetical protein